MPLPVQPCPQCGAITAPRRALGPTAGTVRLMCDHCGAYLKLVLASMLQDVPDEPPVPTPDDE
jgi:hypothetical protein